jgi:hypothetical protein
LSNRYKGMISGGEAVSYRSILECEKLCESIYTDLSLSLRLLRVAKLNRYEYRPIYTVSYIPYQPPYIKNIYIQQFNNIYV